MEHPTHKFGVGIRSYTRQLKPIRNCMIPYIGKSAFDMKQPYPTYMKTKKVYLCYKTRHGLYRLKYFHSFWNFIHEKMVKPSNKAGIRMMTIYFKDNDGIDVCTESMMNRELLRVLDSMSKRTVQCITHIPIIYAIAVEIEFSDTSIHYVSDSSTDGDPFGTIDENGDWNWNF